MLRQREERRGGSEIGGREKAVRRRGAVKEERRDKWLEERK